MKQFNPDWSATVLQKDFKKEYEFPFEYKGPGWYLTDTDTVFVQEDEVSWLWIHVWNLPFKDTAHSETIPTIYDGRT